VSGDHAWPWQATYRGIMRLGGGLPSADVAIVLLPVVFAVAIVQMCQRSSGSPHRWP